VGKLLLLALALFIITPMVGGLIREGIPGRAREGRWSRVIPKSMNPNKRQMLIAMGGIFGAGLVHSLLPPTDIWIRAALTGLAAIAFSGLLALLLPRRPQG